MTDLKLIIGNCNYSSWSLRPWLFLRHHGISFDEHRIALSQPTTGERLSGFFSDLKVPVLRHGDLEVWDSLAILEYLAERFPQLNGWPEAPAARAVARAVSAEMHSSFFDLRAELPMNCRRIFTGFRVTPAVARDVERITTLWRYCREHFGQSGPWLFGRFSIADCMYAPVAIRLIGYEVPLDPESEAYVNTLYHSAALQEWIARGKAESEVIEDEEVDCPSRLA